MDTVTMHTVAMPTCQKIYLHALFGTKATVGKEAAFVRCNLQRRWHLTREVVAGQVQHTGVQVVEVQRYPAGDVDPEEQEDCFGHFRVL